MANPIDVALKALNTHLASQVPGLTVRTEWPQPNQKLIYPCLTIFSGQPEFMALQPFRIAVSEPGPDKKVISALICGEYDLKIQLDLWCRTKLERSLLHEQVMAALNPAVSPMGLSLKLADYFDTWARFDVSGHSPDDDGESAQRGEWRVRIDLLGNVKLVRTVSDYAMMTIENQVQT